MNYLLLTVLHNMTITAGVMLFVVVFVLIYLLVKAAARRQRVSDALQIILNADEVEYSFSSYFKTKLAEYALYYLKGRNISPDFSILEVPPYASYEDFLKILSGTFDEIDEKKTSAVRSPNGGGFITLQCRLEKKWVWVVLKVDMSDIDTFKLGTVPEIWTVQIGTEYKVATVSYARVMYARDHEFKAKMVMSALSSVQRFPRLKKKVTKSHIPIYQLVKSRGSYSPVSRIIDLTSTIGDMEVLDAAYNELTFEIGNKSIEVPMSKSLDVIQEAVMEGVNVLVKGTHNTGKSVFTDLLTYRLVQEGCRVIQIPIISEDNAESIVTAVGDIVFDKIFTVFIVEDCGTTLHNSASGEEKPHHTAIKTLLDSMVKKMGNYSFVMNTNESKLGFLEAIVRRGRIGIQMSFGPISVEKADVLANALNAYLVKTKSDLRFFDFEGWEKYKESMEEGQRVTSGIVFDYMKDPERFNALSYLSEVEEMLLKAAAEGNRRAPVISKENLSSVVQVEYDDKNSEPKEEEEAPSLSSLNNEEYDIVEATEEKKDSEKPVKAKKTPAINFGSIKKL